MPAFFYLPIIGHTPPNPPQKPIFPLAPHRPARYNHALFSNPALPERPKTETDSPIANSLQNSLILSKAIKQPCFYGA